MSLALWALVVLGRAEADSKNDHDSIYGYKTLVGCGSDAHDDGHSCGAHRDGCAQTHNHDHEDEGEQNHGYGRDRANAHDHRTLVRCGYHVYGGFS